MAKLLGSEHYQIKISEKDLLEAMDFLVKYQDEPIADPVCIPQYFVTKLARETGTIVLHAGEGADEILCGYPKYLQSMAHHNKLWNPLSCFPRMLSKLAYLATRSFSNSPLISGKVADIFRRRSLGQDFFMSSAVAYYESEKQEILSPHFRSKMDECDSFDVVRPFYARFSRQVDKPSFLQLLTFIELNLRLPELLLMRTDKMGMANSVEVRVPFLDHKLIEFALSVSESFKVRNNIPKEPLKRLAAEFMPEDRVYRPKAGFGAPIREWFGKELGESFRELLKDKDSEIDLYFDRRFLLKRLNSGAKTTNQAFQLWTVYNFLRWKKYIDQLNVS